MRELMGRRLLGRPVSGLVVIGCAALGLWGAPARAQNYSYLYRISNFQSYVLPGGDATRSDRYFTSTGFEGISFTMNTSNISHFKDGRLWFPAYGSNPPRSYVWTDAIPADLGGTDNQPWDPDRPDWGSPYLGEVNDPKTATLKEVFESGIVNRLMDGENNVANAYLELYFGSGAYVQSDGNAQTPELVLLERGGNSAVYIQAIRSNGTYSNTLAVNIRSGTGTDYDPVTNQYISRVGGSAGFSADTMEIGSAQPVYGTGIDLMAFGNVSTMDRIIGYRIWFTMDTGGNTFCNGPDLHGFILSKPPTPVPEASSLLAMSTFVMGGLTALRLRRPRRARR